MSAITKDRGIPLDKGPAIKMLKRIERAEDTLIKLNEFLLEEKAFPKGERGAKMYIHLCEARSILDDVWFYIGINADLGKEGAKMVASRRVRSSP